MHGLVIAGLFLLLIGAASHHGHHYRRNRRTGFGVWYSLRGPWGSRVTVSKRWR